MIRMIVKGVIQMQVVEVVVQIQVVEAVQIENIAMFYIVMNIQCHSVRMFSVRGLNIRYF